MDHSFAIVTRDGLWRGGSMIEERLSHGVAEQRGAVIKATDTRDDELARICDERFGAIVRAVAPLRERLRGIAYARRVTSANGDDVFASAVITVGGLVVTPEDLAGTGTSKFDVRSSKYDSRFEPRTSNFELPVLWTNGSASVLLHEAIGHAAEEGAPPLAWPEWLRVRDEPRFKLDDGGNVARMSDLLRERPAALRRATFKDVPIPRMTRVIVDGEHPFELPKDHVEVQLTAGGRYDPLTDRVTVSVARATQNGEALAPFVIRTTRDRICHSLLGATGKAKRYPGVICSTDGQKLVVESFAPTILTAELS